MLRRLLYMAGGALIGFLYYKVVGCQSGSCVITSSPTNAMLYMGFVGFLLSGGCCCGDSCKIDDHHKQD